MNLDQLMSGPRHALTASLLAWWDVRGSPARTLPGVALHDVTEAAVLAAVAEYDAVGRDRFLEKAGFGRAKSYFLELDGKLYDSKAIVGHAHGISGDRPWRAEDFSGGDKTVADCLRTLGFTVRYLRNPNWTWDEIVLACALVEENGWRTVAGSYSAPTAGELMLIRSRVSA